MCWLYDRWPSIRSYGPGSVINYDGSHPLGVEREQMRSQWGMKVIVVERVGEQLDLVVKGGLVVSSRGIRKADIAVSGGIIARIEEGIDEQSALEFTDALAKLTFPGILDVYVKPVGNRPTAREHL